jgi:hypothetical protein
LLDIISALANEKRTVNLSATGKPPFTALQVPSFRLCPMCLEPCDSSELKGCKHVTCPSCSYYFCAVCLRHESICYHRPDYYWRTCSIPQAPLQNVNNNS